MTPRHGDRILSEWQALLKTLGQKAPIILDGKSLDIPKLVAVARYGTKASVDELPQDVVDHVAQSVRFLRDKLAQGHSIYGVTTGFGGSADTTTTATDTLQTALLQMQLSAVLPVFTDQTDGISRRNIFPDSFALATLSMPEAWVRGAMLVRCNSLLRGHSAVRLDVIKSLLALLQNDVIPLVPLHGSISASGDLCPLSYVAGAVAGNPDVRVWTGPRSARKLMTSDQALASLKIHPVVFGPKETLGLLNGTAMSAAVATLAQHQADHLLLLAQILTAMDVEALLGRVESFDPFIAEVRPHRGQREVAQNITSFLKGSLLAEVIEHEERYKDHLRQDRYALRTASQWMGPYVEDLVLARDQLNTELNSTTDNPMIDISARKVHHAGNFQAVSVTTATEKTRLALQMIGKIIFAQSCELLDVHQNNGLPPNLAADEPSVSYTLKGVDINMAAYMAELSFLANPVSSHVQSAEMHNQAVNSLALISARYTHKALDVLSLMSSAYLYSLCQALDLRVMNALFLERLRPALQDITTATFTELLVLDDLDTLHHSIWTAVGNAVAKSTTRDSTDRFINIAKLVQPLLIDSIGKFSLSNTLNSIISWTEKTEAISKSIFNANRTAYLANPDATPFLGAASKRMYNFVRKDLQIPFHRGLVDHPTFNMSGKRSGLKNTGSQISVIYEALRDERLMVPIMACMNEALEKDRKMVVTSKL